MNFGLGRLRINRFLVQYDCHAKISSFVEKFSSGMVKFEPIRFSTLLLGEPILTIGQDISLGRLIRVSGLVLVLSGPLETIVLSFFFFP